jgi:TatD DNase family protein
VLKCIEEYTTQSRVLPVLHWFSGSIADARKAVELGCYFSVNGRSLEHETGTALICSLPEDRLLTETDGPFTSRGNRPAEPADVVTTIERLAAARRMGAEEMGQRVRANAQRVFAFAGLNVELDTPT